MKNINRMNRQDLIKRALPIIKVAPKLNRYASYRDKFKIDVVSLKDSVKCARAESQGSVKRLRNAVKEDIYDIKMLNYREAHPDYAKAQDKRVEAEYHNDVKNINSLKNQYLAEHIIPKYLKQSTEMIKLCKQTLRYFTNRRDQLRKALRTKDYDLMRKQGNVTHQITTASVQAQGIQQGQTFDEAKRTNRL